MTLVFLISCNMYIWLFTCLNTIVLSYLTSLPNKKHSREEIGIICFLEECLQGCLISSYVQLSLRKVMLGTKREVKV